MSSGFSWRQGLRLILALGWSDFVLKYRGSSLGYLWSLMAPLTRFLVILYVLGPFMRKDIPLYPLYLLLGIIIWEHFVGTVTGCMTMLFDKQTVIQKVRCSRILLILAVGWTNLLIFLTHLILFLVFELLMGVYWRIGHVFVLLMMVQMTFLALGVGMVMSAYALKFRDIPHLWNVASQLLFWLTPVVYRYQPALPLGQAFLRLISGLPTFHLWWLFDVFVLFQPLSILIYDARRILLYAESTGLPTLVHTAAFTGACMLIFAAGVAVFQRRSRYFLQEY